LKANLVYIYIRFSDLKLFFTFKYTNAFNKILLFAKELLSRDNLIHKIPPAPYRS